MINQSEGDARAQDGMPTKRLHKSMLAVPFHDDPACNGFVNPRKYIIMVLRDEKLDLPRCHSKLPQPPTHPGSLRPTNDIVFGA